MPGLLVHALPVRAPRATPRARLMDLQRCQSPAARAERVVALLLAMLCLNLGDLYMTLAFATSVGMIEGNPIARLVMEYDCPNLLIAWKVGSMLLSAAMLFIARRTRVAEFAAWMVVLLLVWLTLQWDQYSAEMPRLTGGLVAMAEMHPDKWVTIEP